MCVGIIRVASPLMVRYIYYNVNVIGCQYGKKEVMQTTTHTLTLHGYRLHYRVVGAGSPLVLVHGFGVSGHVWQRVLPYLAQEYQVFVVDLPGYGRSTYRETRAPWQLRAMAPLLAAWLCHMQLSAVHLVGHSMGGAIAIHLATHAPELVKSLTLIDAAGMPFRSTFPALALRSARSFSQRGNGSYPVALWRDIARPRLRLILRNARQMVTSDFRVELTELEQRALPTLIVWGEQDVLVPLPLGYELHQALPHATFVIIPTSGHRPMLAQPALISGILLAFLEEQEN